MTHPRLSLALDGADPLPEDGRILVIGPHAAADLSDLPKDHVVAVQGFRPIYDSLTAHGFETVPDLATTDDGFATAVIFLPRSRAEARGMIAAAVARVKVGARVLIDGQKTDGVDSMLKDIRRHVAVQQVIAKAHGKIFTFVVSERDLFKEWQAGDLSPVPGFVTRPGVFSADKADRGSQLLAAALPDALNGRVADLGAGWGWLSAQILSRDGVTEAVLIEADHTALACARLNVTDPRARFHWADATKFRPETKFDAVVTNPPFHQGRAAEPALGAGFIEAAAAMLKPSGVLFMVANRHLPYEATLAKQFRDVAEIGGDSGFKIIRAARPSAAPRSLR